jgi:DNA-binding transcriptional LysR family regulator
MSLPARQLINRLRMRQVSLLLSVCEQGTLHAAARELGMTQPAATKMMRELELSLGTPLFDRVGRGLKLNAAGSTVLDYFQGMVGTLESLTRELSAIRQGIHGVLSVGSIMAASPAILTNALIAIRERLPLLTIRVTTGTSDLLIQSLDAGELDVVIGRPVAHSHADYTFHALSKETLCVIAASNHPVVKEKKLTLSALLPYPWILQSSGSPMRELIDQEFRAAGLKPPAQLIETSSILTTVDIVARTPMIAVIPESVAHSFSASGSISVLKYRLSHQLDPYGILLRPDRPLTMASSLFVELLKKNAGQHAG